MSKKIRVLQSVTSFGIGGNEIFVMNFFRHINKEKFQIDFIIYDSTKMNFYDEVIQAGSRVFICQKKYNNKYLQLISQIGQVKRILKNHDYDIIHCHSCSFVGILRGVVPGFLTKGVKVISHAHSLGTPKNTIFDSTVRRFIKLLLSYMVDKGCACSDTAAKSKYTKKFMNSEKYSIVNNAIESEKYLYDFAKRNKIRKKLNLRPENFVIGNVGRLEYEKNQTFLIDIFKNILDRNSNAILLLVGDGSLRQSLEKKVQKYAITSQVIFLGQCESAADYYQAMDCFVLPSYYEGFPFVLVEAQMNGLRCIVSENITRSVNISGGVKFCSLELGAKKWSDEICKFGNQRMNAEQIQEVILKYDLKREVLRLEKIYEVLKKDRK